MGKYMKKAKGPMAVMELISQEQLGVRTRARTQALEKDVKKSSRSTSTTKTYGTEQISYLELRSRRLEKHSIVCNKTKLTAASVVSAVAVVSTKTASNEECRRLSDLTNSDMIADECTSRLAEDAQNSKVAPRQQHNQTCDENTGVAFRMSTCQGDTNTEEINDSLHCSVIRSLQQIKNGNNRGRPPPGAALSRNNSRSNSVSRELPPSSQCNQRQTSQRILTRNRKKLEKQMTAGNSGTTDIEAVDIRTGVTYAGPNFNSCETRIETELSFGENRIDETLSGKLRVVRESTPLSEVAGEEQPTSMPIVQIQSQLDSEIEDFFKQAEKQQHNRFIERYNFDPVNEIPLSGRYEWAKLGL